MSSQSTGHMTTDVITSTENKAATERRQRAGSILGNSLQRRKGRAMPGCAGGVWGRRRDEGGSAGKAECFPGEQTLNLKCCWTHLDESQLRTSSCSATIRTVWFQQQQQDLTMSQTVQDSSAESSDLRYIICWLQLLTGLPSWTRSWTGSWPWSCWSCRCRLR